MEEISQKLKDIRSAKMQVEKWKSEHKKIVFTNGCFDILHAGHIDYLEKARRLGDRVVVGLNTDRSVIAQKGPTRPVQDQHSRARVLAALQCVDLIILFDEDIPLSLIRDLLPDVLVKGGDYLTDDIVGAEIVKENKGVVKALDFLQGYSTTAIIDKIKKQH